VRGPPWPRAVLLDWDNTLVENWRSIQGALNAALDSYGRPPLTLDEVMFQGRHSAREIFPRLFGADAKAARARFEAHFSLNHLAGLRMMPGAAGLLESLRVADVPLVVVSNKDPLFLGREIAHMNWQGYFAAVVGAQEAAADKPDPAPLLLGLSRIGQGPGPDVWMVGDTDIDMKAAVAAGCTPILVGPGPDDASLLAEATPALRCHNCDALQGFVQQRRDTISRTYQVMN
jgi:phosphoglycolate phosphatase